MFFRKWKKDHTSQVKGFYNLEFSKKILKFLLNSNFFTNYERIYIYNLLIRVPSKFSISFVRKFCVLGGYPKSILRKFKLSRHQYKKIASYGYLSGLRKSSF